MKAAVHIDKYIRTLIPQLAGKFPVKVLMGITIQIYQMLIAVNVDIKIKNEIGRGLLIILILDDSTFLL